MDKPNQGASGHFGVIKYKGVDIGGFFAWAIGMGLQDKKWIASTRKWWIRNEVKNNCDVLFYLIADDNEVLMEHAKNVTLDYGVNTKDKRINSLMIMRKE